MTSKLSVDKLIAALNDLFNAFDEAAKVKRSYKDEKIPLIGDHFTGIEHSKD